MVRGHGRRLGQDHDHSEGGRGGDVLNPRVVDTGELKGTWPGKLRAYSRGEVVASIDPAETSTPVTDAADAINADAGEGKIELPDGYLDQGEPLRDLADIDLVCEEGLCRINFTDLSAPGWLMDDAGDAGNQTVDNVVFRGDDYTNRSEPRAIHVKQNAAAVNFGRVEFNRWNEGAPTIHYDTGAIYSSTWEYVRAYKYRGRFFEINSGTAMLNVDEMFLRPESHSSTTSTFAIYISREYADVKFGVINTGSGIGPVLRTAAGPNDHTQLGILNWEPDGGVDISTNSAPQDALIDSYADSHLDVEAVRVRTGTAAYVVRMTGTNSVGAINTKIGKIANIGTLTQNHVAIDQAPVYDGVGDNPNRFGGRSEAVDVNYTPGPVYGLWCEGDGRPADPAVETTVSVAAGGAARAASPFTSGDETDMQWSLANPSGLARVRAGWEAYDHDGDGTIELNPHFEEYNGTNGVDVNVIAWAEP